MVQQQPQVSWAPRPGSGVLGGGAELCSGGGGGPLTALPTLRREVGRGEEGWRQGPRRGSAPPPLRFASRRGLFSVKSLHL